MENVAQDPADTTSRLLIRAKQGDGDALNALFERHIPILKRWATGRLARWARDIADTQDLVQETVLETFKRIEVFEPRGKGALRAYLRQALLNRVRNEFRRANRHPVAESLDPGAASFETSPLDAAIRDEQLTRYHAALQRLTAQERDLITARLEMGLSYEELAGVFRKPSWNAARMATVRALLRLADQLQRDLRSRSPEDKHGA